MADDRKQSDGDGAFLHLPKMPLLSSATSAVDSASQTSYALRLQLQYQQQLAALETTYTAAAAHELSQPGPHLRKEHPQNLQAFPYRLTSGQRASPLPDVPPLPYRQPGFANKPAQHPSAGVATCTATHTALLASALICHALSHRTFVLSESRQQGALLCASFQWVHVYHHLPLVS